MSKRIGIYPGTFDPITLGHADIIRRGAKLVDHLIIGVTTNPSKDPMFSTDERLIADAARFEHALSHALRQILRNGGYMLYKPNALVGPTDPPLSPEDRDLVRKVLRDTGFREIEFRDD